ncbi:ATP-binding protein [Oxalobacteraceae bacterium R-40]|uniref:ATP-binding protein n=1 Tax=Keguizhuia sedimenti TaxID=3064264 RepID=A0ABU1BPA2_9BURK|nr:ATP-binding protein [Oxalobacteraceae bacterium R-40]
MATPSFHPTTVNPGGLTALIRNLGRDCAPNQFLREFPMNGIEACIRASKEGNRIEVDYNEVIYEKHGLYKISFTDNGDGMTADQMISLLNSLSASGTKNQYENYGVGAKISALTRNHQGIQYESWRNGVGHMVVIQFNEEEGAYGLQGFPTNSGEIEFAPRIKNSNKPKIIKDHGTRVTLWGMHKNQDTMAPPEGVSGIRESWILLYLNSRFFRIPKGIELYARIGYYRDPADTKHNHLLRVVGQKAALDAQAEHKGEMKISNAKIYWWIMPKGADGHGRTMLRGHTALVNQDEVFEISDARSNKLAYFGVIYGRERVVIYVEPENAVQNTARTGLVKPDGSPLQWDSWQDEFRENMPPVLRKFLDSLIEENSKDSHSDSIRERLKGIKELFRLSRYRRSDKGGLFADPNSESLLLTGHERSEDGPRPDHPRPKPGLRPGPIVTALLTELVDQEEGVRVVPASPDPFPRVEWSHETESMVDRAAEYLPKDNLIIANKDFQGFRDLVAYFSRNHQDTPEILRVIEDVVREAFEQVLIECVAGALSLKNRPHWNPSDFANATSKEALTTVVMQRYWIVNHVKRVLGSKIKGFSELLNQQGVAA